MIAKMLVLRLRSRTKSALSSVLQRERWQRAAIAVWIDGCGWNEELVLQRRELLYEAALIPEAVMTRECAAAAPGFPVRRDDRRSPTHSRH